MISVIIPTFNEEGAISTTIRRVKSSDRAGLVSEIIVADGGSIDNTLEEAETSGVKIVRCKQKGRAAQMNEAASFATSDVLYFLHADTFPPAGFTGQIRSALEKNSPCGCFQLKFDHQHWLLNSMAWFTRFETGLFRFGDQSLFVKKDLFETVGGFNESLKLMEDQEIIWRLKRLGDFVVLPDQVTTSARKYLDNGPLRLTGIFMYIYFLYYSGASQQTLVQHYRRLVTNGKV